MHSTVTQWGQNSCALLNLSFHGDLNILRLCESIDLAGEIWLLQWRHTTSAHNKRGATKSNDMSGEVWVVEQNSNNEVKSTENQTPWEILWLPNGSWMDASWFYEHGSAK